MLIQLARCVLARLGEQIWLTFWGERVRPYYAKALEGGIPQANIRFAVSRGMPLDDYILAYKAGATHEEIDAAWTRAVAVDAKSRGLLAYAMEREGGKSHLDALDSIGG